MVNNFFKVVAEIWKLQPKNLCAVGLKFCRQLEMAFFLSRTDHFIQTIAMRPHSSGTGG